MVSGEKTNTSEPFLLKQLQQQKPNKMYGQMQQQQQQQQTKLSRGSSFWPWPPMYGSNSNRTNTQQLLPNYNNNNNNNNDNHHINNNKITNKSPISSNHSNNNISYKSYNSNSSNKEQRNHNHHQNHYQYKKDRQYLSQNLNKKDLIQNNNNNNNNNKNSKRDKYHLYSGGSTSSKVCYCRSKSMEDVRADVDDVDWSSSHLNNNHNHNNNNNNINNNNNYSYNNNNNNNNSSDNIQNNNNNNNSNVLNNNNINNHGKSSLSVGPLNKYIGRSMDNINENEILYGKQYQILPTIDPNRPKFVAVTSLEDVQAVRCAEFHPNGKVYAVGSNSKTFRICEYPSLSEIREEHTTYQPTVLFKRTKHHKGSIYCMAWSPQGDLVATGSNDKTVKLMRYNDVQKQLEGREVELTMHDGTVRDLCFIEDSSNQSSLLISGGAGDCKIYVTDCATSTPFQALSGHGGHVLSLYNWGGAMFVSGSQDKTVRFWDLRTRGCVNMVTPATVPGSRQGSAVASLCVDPSGRLLVSGHEDSSCVLYDIRGNRPIQCFKPHSSDIRSIRFSPSAYYLLTGGYDNKLVLTDLQGDLTLPLPSVVVAQHTDKIISARWHPTDFSFISTSADKTSTLWALPPI